MNNHIPKCACPSCGSENDRASSPTDPERSPVEGDITVCLYCGTTLLFNADLTRRELTDLEHQSLPLEIQFELSQIKAAVHLSRVMKGPK